MFGSFFCVQRRLGILFLGASMSYHSAVSIRSAVDEGVCFRVARMSFGRRVELMRKVRELARRMEFLEAGEDPGERMDAGLLKAEIDRMFLLWGLIGVSGLILDGAEATPETLVERGPEELFCEALTAVRRETGLTDIERKN